MLSSFEIEEREWQGRGVEPAQNNTVVTDGCWKSR